MNPRLVIIISFVCVLLADMVDYMSVSMSMAIDGTYIIAALKIISVCCLLAVNAKIDWRVHMTPRAIFFFKLFIAWNIITILRGVFSARDYWEWKYLILNTSFSLLIPFAFITGLLYDYSRELFIFIITKIFLLGFILIPLTLKIDTDRELYARSIAMGTCFFILLTPYLKFRWRLLVFAVAATSIFLSPDFRTNIIRIGVATIIMLLYYTRRYIGSGLLNTGGILLFIMPLVLLFLGVNKQFNIFHPAENIEKYEYAYDNGSEKNMAVDTRTFLYQEVFSSMGANDSFLLGEGGAGSYKTDYFEEMVSEGRRYGAEVGFLDTLLYSGILGVLLYALVLFSAVRYGINHSNNFLCKMVALFLAFRWILFFVEDITKYDVNFYMIWLGAGLCFSKRFRALTDADIALYLNFKKPQQPAATINYNSR